MPRTLLLFIPLTVILAMSACATGPRFDRDQFDDAIPPAQAARDAEQLQGAELLWGGLIVDTRNLEDGSEMEVLAYPLDRAQQPDVSRTPLGRFLTVTNDYLETVDYAQGRLITVAGPLAGTREGRVGEARYVYPVIEAGPQGIYLWPVDRRTRSGPNFSIGLGVMLGR